MNLGILNFRETSQAQNRPAWAWTQWEWTHVTRGIVGPQLVFIKLLTL